MAFKNTAQRKAFFAKLNAAKKTSRRRGFKTSKVDVTERHFRFRQEPPGRFQKKTFRVKDVGGKGGMKLIVARPKGKTTTRVQSVLLSRGST